MGDYQQLSLASLVGGGGGERRNSSGGGTLDRVKGGRASIGPRPQQAGPKISSSPPIRGLKRGVISHRFSVLSPEDFEKKL